MEQKNYTEVLIDGTVYTLGGTEEEAYIQRVAAYLNEKISSIRHQGGFRRLSVEYQALMLELNIADDYFKEQERADLLAEQKAAMEKDAYSLKHELITTQLRMERDQEELERLRNECRNRTQEPQKSLQQDLKDLNTQLIQAKEEAEKVKAEAQKQMDDYTALKRELEQLKALNAATAAAGHSLR